MDGSEMSERALEYALEAYPDAEITVLHVVGEPSPLWGDAAGLADHFYAGNVARKVVRQSPVLVVVVR